MSGHSFGRGCRVGGSCGCDSFQPGDDQPDYSLVPTGSKTVEEVNRAIRRFFDDIRKAQS